MPYSINAPFWSDGANKERFFALPGNAAIDFNADKHWEWDDGAVTVKSFSLDFEAGKPESKRYIETRIVLKQDDQWRGYTYRWNDQQTDAFLVGAKGHGLHVRDQGSDGPGGVRKQVWHFPSRDECMFCHSRAAGFVLGLTTSQMNREHPVRNRTNGQPAAHLCSYWGFQKASAEGYRQHAGLPGSYGLARRPAGSR